MFAAIAAFFAVHSRLPWIIGIGIMMLSFGGLAAKVKILTLERDAAVLASGVAQAALQHQQRVDFAQMRALTKAREDDRERQKFLEENERQIGRAGDGPLAPVLRDTLGRVRDRYDRRSSAAGDQR